MEVLPETQTVAEMVSVSQLIDLVRRCDDQERLIDAELQKSLTVREHIEMKLELLDVIPFVPLASLSSLPPL